MNSKSERTCQILSAETVQHEVEMVDRDSE